MELERKVRYAVLAFMVVAAVLAALGVHAGVHHGALEKGGIVDPFRRDG